MNDAAARHAWIRPIPNILTVLRLVAAALLPFVPPWWRLPLVIFATVSDWADGVIARRFHAQTTFGRLADGAADKAVVLACVVTFLRSGEVSLWQALAVMARDVTVAVIILVLMARGAWHAFDHVKARSAGKLTTALVFPWFVALLIPGTEPIRPWLFWPAAVTSVAAAIDYALHAKENVHHLEGEES